MAKQKRNETVFHADNKHSPDCGRPPGIVREPSADKYYGYYENAYGEQFVLVYDRTTKEGILRGGDCEWKTKMRLQEMPRSRIAELVGMTSEVDAIHEMIASGRAPSTIQLQNGNYLMVLGWALGRSEMLWLRSCWETIHHFDHVV